MKLDTDTDDGDLKKICIQRIDIKCCCKRKLEQISLDISKLLLWIVVSELHDDNAPAAASSMLAQLQPPKAMRGCVFLISQNNIC